MGPSYGTAGANQAAAMHGNTFQSPLCLTGSRPAVRISYQRLTRQPILPVVLCLLCFDGFLSKHMQQQLDASLARLRSHTLWLYTKGYGLAARYACTASILTSPKQYFDLKN